MSPGYITSTSNTQTGNIVLSLSSPTTANGLDVTTTSFTYITAFSSTPNMALGLSYMSSQYTTTTSSSSWMYNLSISIINSAGASVISNRTTILFSQIAINYLAVLPSFFLEITYASFDLSATSLSSGASNTIRTNSYNINYRAKSNSSNAIININTMGIHTIRQSNTYQYNLAVTGKSNSSYQITITVQPYNGLMAISLCGVSYELVATTIASPYYLDMGYFTDFSGSIIDSSGISDITVFGTIYTAPTSWQVSDGNAINIYNLTLGSSSLNYVLTSPSLQTCTNSYVWYRQLACPVYYYLNVSVCVACHYTCLTCSGTNNTQCLTCSPATRQFVSSNNTCACLTGYVDQSAA